MHLLDANALMEANRLYYAFDIAPGFWTWLGDPTHVGQVASIDAVKDEITAGTGDLVDWARARPDSFDSADYKLIAHAMATGSTVVTREQPAPDSKEKIKIPDVCKDFNVAWTDPFSLYRALGMRLVA